VAIRLHLDGLREVALSQYWVDDVDHLPAGSDLSTAFGQT
jgi:hypothetical protein